MDVVFSKKQLNLLREFVMGDDSSSNKPSLDVSNSEGDKDPSSLRADAEKVAQMDSNNFNKSIDVQSYTNKQIPANNNAQDMTIKVGNGSVGQAASKAQQFIAQTPAQSLPQKIRLVQGREIDKKLVEVTSFKKKDLDKFLKSL
jgi:hypothetical protein